MLTNQASTLFSTSVTFFSFEETVDYLNNLGDLYLIVIIFSFCGDVPVAQSRYITAGRKREAEEKRRSA